MATHETARAFMTEALADLTGITLPAVYGDDGRVVWPAKQLAADEVLVAQVDLGDAGGGRCLFIATLDDLASIVQAGLPDVPTRPLSDVEFEALVESVAITGYGTHLRQWRSEGRL